MAATTTYVKNPLLLFSSVVFPRENIRQPRICRCTVDATKSVSSTGGDVFSITSSNKCDVDYLGQSTKGDLNLNFGIDGKAALEGPIEEVARMEAEEAEKLLKHLGIPDPLSARHSPRGIFCSRTLNLRSISAIGYDMDYTLMHYNVMAWEGRAYDYCMDNLRNMGFPVDGLAFDPDLVIRGLVIDKEKGNLVKADRFGYVKRAMHGTKMLSTREVRCGSNLFILLIARIGKYELFAMLSVIKMG
ncbi:unnamed protein product [Ilex paraguariensis]|uniref:Uncharacterized protein n=1 Tax=Ilex paraguariensis TaxID=185542 RepID=A0ABC8TR93_9AQUA